MISFTNLNEVAEAVRALPGKHKAVEAEALAHQNQLTKPPGALGRLEELAVFLASWQGQVKPSLTTAQAVVFAGNHGICAQGVNPFPQDVTAQMVANFTAGGAAINQLCAVSGAELDVVPLSLDTPTADFTKQEALSEDELCAAMSSGAQAVNPDADILLLGEMGIGNSTVSSALAASVFGGDVARWVGAGTGSDEAGIARKQAVIEQGLKIHGSRTDLSALLAFGGREQAAICGAVLAARMARIPVILDGFICSAAVAQRASAHVGGTWVAWQGAASVCSPETPTSHTSMSADDSPTVEANAFHASCSSPYEYSLSKRTITLREPSMMRSKVLRWRRGECA